MRWLQKFDQVSKCAMHCCTLVFLNHAKNFVADDSSIPLGVRAMTYVLVDYLHSTSTQ
jgi:hypothetical protein